MAPADIRRNLATAGLWGLLPPVPLQQIIPLADSLLASPVLVTAVQTTAAYHHHAIDLLQDLQTRSGPHMLVGTQGDLAPATAAFHLTAQWQASSHPAVVPVVQTSAELDAAVTAGHQLLLARLSAAEIETAVSRHPSAAVFAWGGGMAPSETAVYKQAGAAGCAVQLWRDDAQTMAQTITLARRLRRQWPPT